MSVEKPPVVKGSTAKGIARFGGNRAAALVPQARLAGPMPWVMAIMIALTVIAAAGGMALTNLTRGAQGELSGAVTVQILAAQPQEKARQADMAEKALAELPQVTGLRIVPQSELDELLEPWLGKSSTGDLAVPIPALIDVQLRGSASEGQLAELRAALTSVAPDARVDAQSGWLQPVFGAIEALQWLALALVAMLATISAAAVWLAARSALGSNRDTIEIVHLLGGTDAQIARIFQRSIGFDAAAGGAVGLAIGMVALSVLGSRFAALGSGLMANGGLRPLDWLVIAAIPFVGVAIAMLTARLTALAALRRML
ncbi:MAG: cell division protein FtsX [Tsuneonella suprasediminis]|uniref:Cell division protein n=1 Tax=Tsuneonella suprasediminis TaxID=2306996 RepID=A0A419R5V0_9SPHN|nr:cell division protein [Tsuneonella suprasediminis]RJX71272.1 cell division protein [Tsuneonella suprasediminis]UBS34531.1 cell division protein [Altererythrobacter sp. N1]